MLNKLIYKGKSTCWFSISNIFVSSKAHNDFGFTFMLPVRKRDIVKARFFTVIWLELLQILSAIVFAIINQKLYTNGNFFLEPNVAFFGLALVMYSVFNLVFLPMFYKTGYKVGLPVTIATFSALIFAAIAETSIMLIPALNIALDSDNPKMLIYKLLTLGIGIIIYVVSTMLAFKVSAKRFETIDI